MAVMIACSPSTGSSLLRRLLNRHPDIFCGSETHLLCKANLYHNWSKYKQRLFLGFPLGLRDAAWPHFRGVILDQEYPLERTEVKELVNQTLSFQSFINGFSSKILERTSKKLWIEKTPSNALSASLFLETIPGSKVIHITRNPFDTVASLVNRGMSVFNAVAVYVLNTSHLLTLQDKKRIYVVSYENLVRDAPSTLTEVLEFLGYSFTPFMLDASVTETGVDRMPGWNYSEIQDIGTKSLGRFESMGEAEKARISYYLDHLKLKDTILPSLKEICSRLGYEYRECVEDPKFGKQMKADMLSDMFSRNLRLSYFNSFNYPFEIY